MKILSVTVNDAMELSEIYSYYVENTAISFEYTAPTKDEFEKRISDITEKYPYIKAYENGKIIGYAYATAFKWRKAYDYSVESTIYLRPEAKRKGVGRALYTELERRLREMGILNMNACIAYPKAEDEYLTKDSIYFHEKMGFTPVGTFHYSGYKFDRWYDMIWMEKMLADHTEPAPKINFGMWK